MILAWKLIERVGRRQLMTHGVLWLCMSFHPPNRPRWASLQPRTTVHPTPRDRCPRRHGTIPRDVRLQDRLACAPKGWSRQRSSRRRQGAKGAAVSVVVWEMADIAVTLLTPLGFNRLEFVLLLVFAATNALAGILTYLFVPESGWRTFEENQEFFRRAAEEGSWRVKRAADGVFGDLPHVKDDGERGQQRQQQRSRRDRDSPRRPRDQKTGGASSETSPLLDDRGTY